MKTERPQCHIQRCAPGAVQRGRCAAMLACWLAVACGGGSPGTATDTDTGSSAAGSSCPFAPPKDAALESFCGKSSWTSGSTELCGGHLVYRDYVYDDYGADHPVPTIRWVPTSTNASVLPTGDDAYPVGAENTADLIRFELWPDGDQMRVEFELNTLYAPGQTLALVAIDTDNDAATGGGQWPGFDAGAAGWDELHVFRDGDAASNRITGSFPRPAGSAWKIWAAVAQADGTIMNVAFRGQDETAATGTWFDDAQAKALAAGDVTAFSAGICPSELSAGLTRGAQTRPGFHERVYTSAYTLPPGEGISIAGIEGPKVGKTALDPRVYQAFNFLGRYQPYAYYLPDRPGPHGLQLMLHGFSQTHAAAVGTGVLDVPFGDQLNRVIVSPLGRGLAGGYSDISERDVLDVLDDAMQEFDVDPDRVVAAGVSMGGYGQLAFGTLYPDRFAGLVGWVSPTGDYSTFPLGQPVTYIPGSLVANTLGMVGNLRNVPGVLVYGALDEFVPVTQALSFENALTAAVTAPFDFYLYLDSDHLTTYGVDVTREAALSAGWMRPSRVARVNYRVDPGLDVPAYGVVHDRAYWVSKLRARDTGIYETVALHSFGCGLAETTTADTDDTGAGPVPYVWQHRARRVTSQTPVPAAQRLEGSLANVTSLRIDTHGACLTGGAIDYQIDSDGPATLQLDDGRSVTLVTGSNQGRF